MRNEVPSEGRWINADDELERRRVIFLGGRVKEQLFSGRPAVGETVQIGGVRFTVIGVMERKIQLSNYFIQRRRLRLDPVLHRGRSCGTRATPHVLVFEPIAPQFEKKAMAQVLAAVAERQHFSPTDKKAIQMFGREEFRPVIDGLTIGLQVLLTFIGTLTLGHRRRRRDEHHAGVGGRAHPRNRPAPRPRRAQVPHQAAIPRRDSAASCCSAAPSACCSRTSSRGPSAPCP